MSSDKRHTTSKQTFDEGRRKSSGPEAIKEEKKGHFRTKSRESIPSIFRSKSKEALPQLFHTKSKESVSSLPRPKSKDSIPRGECNII